ncbi:MAG: hypothetical protein ACJAYF_003068 [Arenicella sp.]|jgi:hypothetical protein
MVNRNFYRSFQRRQKGVVAIEFVIIFPVLFLICYVIIAYAMAFLVLQNYTYAGEEVLRKTIEQCVDATDKPEWEACVGGLSAELKSSLIIYNSSTTTITPDCNPVPSGMLCEIKVSGTPLLGGITIPGFGKLPDLPDQLTGKASLLF